MASTGPYFWSYIDPSDVVPPSSNAILINGVYSPDWNSTGNCETIVQAYNNGVAYGDLCSGAEMFSGVDMTPDLNYVIDGDNTGNCMPTNACSAGYYMWPANGQCYSVCGAGYNAEGPVGCINPNQAAIDNEIDNYLAPWSIGIDKGTVSPFSATDGLIGNEAAAASIPAIPVDVMITFDAVALKAKEMALSQFENAVSNLAPSSSNQCTGTVSNVNTQTISVTLKWTPGSPLSSWPKQNPSAQAAPELQALEVDFTDSFNFTETFQAQPEMDAMGNTVLIGWRLRSTLVGSMGKIRLNLFNFIKSWVTKKNFTPADIYFRIPGQKTPWRVHFTSCNSMSFK